MAQGSYTFVTERLSTLPSRVWGTENMVKWTVLELGGRILYSFFRKNKRTLSDYLKLNTVDFEYFKFICTVIFRVKLKFILWRSTYSRHMCSFYTNSQQFFRNCRKTIGHFPCVKYKEDTTYDLQGTWTKFLAS